MTKPTLLILSVGELATNMLEAVARSGLFDKIVIAGRDIVKARARANSTMIGAGLEGHYPEIIGAQLDVESNEFVQIIQGIAPDYVITTASLMPWWRLEESKAPPLPFGGYVSLHLSLLQLFRDRLAEANLDAIWINASYPDVINPVLCRSGFGPLCGIGNVQEPVPKIIGSLVSTLGVKPVDVSVRLVAHHAFEYFVFSETEAVDHPPYLLHVEVGGEDLTDQARQILFEPFPFRYDHFFNRVTASAAVEALAAFTSSKPTQIHLPGVNGLIGGYPVQVNGRNVSLNLHSAWSESDARNVNERSLTWEGIECIDRDGSIHFTDEAQKAFRNLIGSSIKGLKLNNVHDHAKRILDAL